MSKKSQSKEKKGFLGTLGALALELIESIGDAVEILEEF
jgi:hypothetical protein